MLSAAMMESVVDPEEGFDLRLVFAALSPAPAAAPADEDQAEDEVDNEESGDEESSDSEDDSEDSDEESDEDEEEKGKSEKLIKELREEARRRRLNEKKLKKELNELRRQLEDKDSDKEDEGPTEREKSLLIQLGIRDTMQELKLNPAKTKQIVRLIDSDDIEFEGNDVIGLREALEEIAEENPEWIISEKKSEDKPASGSSTNRKRSNGNQFDRKTLEEKYPELIGR